MKLVKLHSAWSQSYYFVTLFTVKIPDTDISRVAGILPNWQIVAKKLGFGEQDIEDIETKHQAPAEQRKAFVRNWIRKNGTRAKMSRQSIYNGYA